MSRFRLPTSKGTELFPRVIQAPVRVRFEGANVGSPEARALFEAFEGKIEQFYQQCANAYALSIIEQATQQRIEPGLRMIYQNNQGSEVVYVWVDAPVRKQIIERAGITQEVPGDFTLVCIDVMFQLQFYTSVNAYFFPAGTSGDNPSYIRQTFNDLWGVEAFVGKGSDNEEYGCTCPVDWGAGYDSPDDYETSAPTEFPTNFTSAAVKSNLRAASMMDLWLAPASPGDTSQKPLWSPAPLPLTANTADNYLLDGRSPAITTTSSDTPEIIHGFVLNLPKGHEHTPLKIDIYVKSWNYVLTQPDPHAANLLAWNTSCSMKIRVREYPPMTPYAAMQNVEYAGHENNGGTVTDDIITGGTSDDFVQPINNYYGVANAWRNVSPGLLAPKSDPGMGGTIFDGAYHSVTPATPSGDFTATDGSQAPPTLAPLDEGKGTGNHVCTVTYSPPPNGVESGQGSVVVEF